MNGSEVISGGLAGIPCFVESGYRYHLGLQVHTFEKSAEQ